MRVVIQRVKRAKCIVEDRVTGEIEHGLMLLVGFTHDDDMDKIEKAAKKIVNMRIFDDEAGKMNLNVMDVKGNILSISQFTLYGNTDKGNRPYFQDAMAFDKANELYQMFNEELRKYGNLKIAEGEFGAHMYLDIMCDGPVTINLEY